MKVPNGLAEIIAEYGDPKPYTRPDGTARPEWERHILTTIDLPAPIPLSWDSDLKVEKVRCHIKAAGRLKAVYHSIHAADLWDELRDFGGCYEWRRVSGAKKRSAHSWGIAVDHDVDRNQLGETPMMHPGVIQIFEANGFQWGGRWDRPDGMHFQLCSGY